jgi:hypothetical protein
MTFLIKNILAVLAFSFLLISCSSNNKNNQNTKEYNSTYVCPMHCEGSGGEEPGICPVCGMDYEKNPKQKSFKSKPVKKWCGVIASN